MELDANGVHALESLTLAFHYYRRGLLFIAATNDQHFRAFETARAE